LDLNLGRLLKIYLRPERQKPVIKVTQAEARVGTGLEGDHLKKGSRQVTLLSVEAWQAVCQDLGKELDPSLRRANLLIEGLDLKETIGKFIQIGSAVVKVTGETKPCRLMDEAEAGLKYALVPDWRGGVFGEVITPGHISIGDIVSWKDDNAKT
jgi:MOSC domain-containing protein YiiM